MGGVVIGKLLAFAARIIPPASADERQLGVWRAFIATATLLLMFGLAGHIAWACGYIPGLPGFARAQDVHELKTDFRKQQIRLLEQALLDMRARQCRAIVDDNREAKRFTAERMAQLSTEYYALAGYLYPVPDCNAL